MSQNQSYIYISLAQDKEKVRLFLKLCTLLQMHLMLKRRTEWRMRLTTFKVSVGDSVLLSQWSVKGLLTNCTRSCRNDQLKELS